MAYKVNDTTVIDDTGNIQSVAGLTLNNDSGVISVQSTSPMVGTVAGYTSGGILLLPTPPVQTNVIDKFPFATDTNSTDVGDLIAPNYSGSVGQSSSTHGYFAGGSLPTVVNVIQKFIFAIDSNSTDVGNLTGVRNYISGQSSFTHGYSSGGSTPAPGPTGVINSIEKFPFSSDSNATDVGDLTQTRYGAAGQSSTTFGYNAGGNAGSFSNTIDKFPFAADANASDVGDILTAGTYFAGQSSTTHGYASGGTIPGPASTNTIQKFPFSSDTNASDVGDLTEVKTSSAGQSSLSHGYSSGGAVPTPAYSNTIEKFPFATDTNASDVGDLTQSVARPMGQQD